MSTGGFPKKGNRLDIVAYYRLSTTEQKTAKTWLEVNGSEEEKQEFLKVQQKLDEQIAQEEAQAELRKSMRDAPNKHGQKKSKPGSGSGGCSVQ